MKTWMTGLALVALLAAAPAHALSKCKARDGTLTYTDTNCHRYGKTMPLKLRDTSSYSSVEARDTNLRYVSLMESEHARVVAETQQQQAAADAAIAAAKSASTARAAQQAKLAIDPPPPMEFNHGSYRVSPTR